VFSSRRCRGKHRANLPLQLSLSDPFHTEEASPRFLNHSGLQFARHFFNTPPSSRVCSALLPTAHVPCSLLTSLRTPDPPFSSSDSQEYLVSGFLLPRSPLICNRMIKELLSSPIGSPRPLLEAHYLGTVWRRSLTPPTCKMRLPPPPAPCFRFRRVGFRPYLKVLFSELGPQDDLALPRDLLSHALPFPLARICSTSLVGRDCRHFPSTPQNPLFFGTPLILG